MLIFKKPQILNTLILNYKSLSVKGRFMILKNIIDKLRKKIESKVGIVNVRQLYK